MIYGLRVLAMGGGTGLSPLLAGLKRFVHPPLPGSGESLYFADISAFVTVTDDGGSSGRLRDELHALPPGDIRNCLVALSADESLLGSLFQYRFRGSGALRGHNFGNLFITALASVTGDFYEAVRVASQVLAIPGRIFPSSNQNVTLVAELDDGERVKGETSISASRKAIRRIALEPPDCSPPAEALEALEQADLIVLGPGSLYTSLIPNLLVPGVTDAIARSDALVVLLANVMTQPGETTGYSLSDHVAAVVKHCPNLKLSCILANDEPIALDLLERYRRDGAELVTGAGDENLPCPVIQAHLLQAGSVVRHDGVKTARALQSLFDNLRVHPPSLASNMKEGVFIPCAES